MNVLALHAVIGCGTARTCWPSAGSPSSWAAARTVPAGYDNQPVTTNSPGLRWRKSSYSSDTANCVEVAPTDSGMAVRDSKDVQGPVLWFTAGAWQAFVAAVRDGDL
jgi:hypothetical protein